MSNLTVDIDTLEVNIMIVDDEIAEAMEEFTFMIMSTAGSGVELAGNGPFTVSIMDNDSK